MTDIALSTMLMPGHLSRSPTATSYMPARRMFRSLSSLVSQLRIDVALPEQTVEHELDALYKRWFSSGASLEAPSDLHLAGQPIVFKIREADGEHFIYALDPVREKLAAYIVMSRLIELNRRADRHLRSPHAKVAIAYRRLGIASTVYRWWLDSGRSLISGARQSPAANQLWRSLELLHPTVYVSLSGKRVRPLGTPISEELRDDIDTRVVLLGKGCHLEAFVSQ